MNWVKAAKDYKVRCPGCDWVDSYSGNLSQDEGEKRWICPDCGKPFSKGELDKVESSLGKKAGFKKIYCVYHVRGTEGHLEIYDEDDRECFTTVGGALDMLEANPGAYVLNIEEADEELYREIQEG